MGNEYKQNYKNLVGRPNIIGRDVWDVGVTLAAAPAAAVALSDRLGGESYELAVAARLDGVTIQATGVLGLGRIGVEVQLNGAVIASGSLYAGGPDSVYIPLSVTALQDVAIASGEALTVNASVELSLDTGQALRTALNLTLLEYPERA